MQQGLGVFVDVIGKDSLSGPAAAAGASLLGIEKSAGSLGNVLAGVEKGIVGVGVAITATVATIGAALTTLAVVGVKQAGELQQAVANISSIKPEINTQGVFSSLNLMQTRVAQSAKDMGAALYNLFSSIDATAEQGLALVEKFGRGAVASLTDAQTFGTAIVGEMNAFKTGVEQTDHLMDIFFNTVKVGVVTGQELATNLGLVAQNAKVAGVSVEELGGFIAGVTKEGGTAAQNINNLANLFQKIVTKEAIAGFKEIGVQVTDATGKFRPMIDVLTDLRGKLVTYTQSAAAAALQNIFPDVQARQGALTILNELGTVRAAIEENKNSAGAAEDAYTRMSQTFETQTKLLRQGFDSILTSVGAGLLPVLTSVTSSVQGFVKDTAPLFDAWQTRLQNAFKAGGFDPWLKEVGNVAGELGREIEKWIPAFTGWADKAKDKLGTTLREIYDGTIVPWVTDRANDLKKKFETEWIPALTDWWDTATRPGGVVTQKMDAFADVIKAWAGDGGSGNAAVKEAGVSLGTALVNSFQQQAVDAFGQLPDWMQDVLRGKLGVFPQVTPGGGSSGAAIAPTAPSAPSLPPGAITLPNGGVSLPLTTTGAVTNIGPANVVPNQFGPDQELTKAQADAACGPAAAVAFARIYGRNPTLREALMVAQDAGLWTTAGMKGPESQVALLGQMGVPSHTEQGVDWAKVQASIVSGTPVILDTPGHYFAVTGYNAESGQFNFGASGQAIRGGQPWMTPGQAEGLWTGNIRSSIYPNAAPTAAGAGATQFSAFDDLFRSYAGELANDPNFIATVTAGAKAESRLNPNQITPDPTDAMPNAVSIGLFQEHDVHGLSRETRLDPEAAASRMVPKYAEAYRQGQALGLTGAELASYTARYAEVPAGFRDPNGGASQRYTAAYNQVIGSGAPGGSISFNPTPGQMAEVDAGGAAVAAEHQAALESSYQSAMAEQGRTTTDQGVVGGGTENPFALTSGRLMGAFGGADAEAAAGQKGKAIMDAFNTALTSEGPKTVQALAGTLAQLHQALLSDPNLSPEDAQARFADFMQHITDAIDDGSPEAIDALKTFMGQFEANLQIDKIAESTATKANVAIQQASEQITQLYTNRDQAIANLYKNNAIAKQDRDAQQAETDWINNYLSDTKTYIDGQKEQRKEQRETEAAKRQELTETAALEKKYQDERDALLKKKDATASASFGQFRAAGAAAQTVTRVNDPQAGITQQLRDLDTQHEKDKTDLATAQAARRQERVERAQERKDDDAFYKNLDTQLTTAQTSARAINQDWRDTYQLNVTIPRQVADLTTGTQTQVDKINEGLGHTLDGIRSDGDVAIARIQSLQTEVFPALRSEGDTALNGFRTDAEAGRDAVAEAARILAQGASGGGGGSPSTNTILPDNGISANAAGTSSFQGGFSWVGERGPELMRLPQGTQIMSNAQSRSMMADSIDYDRLAGSIVKAQAQHPIMLDGDNLNRNNRTRDRYFSQSNLPRGVGALV